MEYVFYSNRLNKIYVLKFANWVAFHVAKEFLEKDLDLIYLGYL